MNRKLTYIWFLLGLGSRLQVLASLSISEMIVLASAPIIFARTYRTMRRDGIWAFFVLSLCMVAGCVLASIVNHTPLMFVVRGLAVVCIISSSIIFAHWIIRQDPGGFKWYILGLPISAIISVFIFKGAAETAMYGATAEELAEGPIFWITRLQPLVMAPTKGWYLQVPTVFNLGAPLFMAAFAILTSVSGRAAAVSALAFSALVLIGGKTRKSISRISRHFGTLILGGMIFVCAIYGVYKFSAGRGLLGEDARKKYELQTEGGQGGLGRLILGGRGDSFIGLLACRDKPIVGWGPWAADENGYAEEFISKYGTRDDLEEMIRLNSWRAQLGISKRLLSCHSYITSSWVWYGISGLVFWMYVIFVLLRYLKQDVATIPQWFAWLACSIPGMLWGIFFSPLSDRVGCSLFVVACLMARAAHKGVFRLPPEMICEIAKLERR